MRIDDVGLENHRQTNAALELKENSRRGAFPKGPTLPCKQL